MNRSMMSNPFFQGSDHIELLSAQGRTSAENWKCKGRVIKSFDKRIKSNAFHLEGNSDTHIQFPKDTKFGTAVFMQRFLLFQILVPYTRSLCIEIGFSDFQRNRRRLIVSSAFRDFVHNPLHAQIPLSSKVPRDTWMNLVFDMSYLVINSFDYPQDSVDCFKSIDTISISGACHLRRVFTMKDAPRPTDMSFCDGKVARHADIRDIPKQFLYTTTTPSTHHDIPKWKGMGGDGYLVPTEYLMFESASSGQTISSCLKIQSKCTDKTRMVKRESSSRKKPLQNNLHEKSRQSRHQLAPKAKEIEIPMTNSSPILIRRASLLKRQSLVEGHRSNQDTHEVASSMESTQAALPTQSDKLEFVQPLAEHPSQNDNSKLVRPALKEKVQSDEITSSLEGYGGGQDDEASGMQKSQENPPSSTDSAIKSLKSIQLNQNIDMESAVAKRESVESEKADKRQRIMSEIRDTLEGLSCTTTPDKLATSKASYASQLLASNTHEFANNEGLASSPRTIFQTGNDVDSETIASESSTTKGDLSDRLVSLSKEWFTIEDEHEKQAATPLKENLSALAEDVSEPHASSPLDQNSPLDKKTDQNFSYFLQNPHLRVDYSVPTLRAHISSPVRARSANFDDRIASLLVNALRPKRGSALYNSLLQDRKIEPEQCGTRLNDKYAETGLQKDCTSDENSKETDDDEEELSLDLYVANIKPSRN